MSTALEVLLWKNDLGSYLRHFLINRFTMDYKWSNLRTYHWKIAKELIATRKCTLRVLE